MRATRTQSVTTAYRFADEALHKGIRRSFSKLKQDAESDFREIQTPAITYAVMQFLQEYNETKNYVSRIEAAGDIQAEWRSDWHAAEERCRLALRDIQASPLGGDLKNTVMRSGDV